MENQLTKTMSLIAYGMHSYRQIQEGIPLSVMCEAIVWFELEVMRQQLQSGENKEVIPPLGIVYKKLNKGYPFIEEDSLKWFIMETKKVMEYKLWGDYYHRQCAFPEKGFSGESVKKEYFSELERKVMKDIFHKIIERDLYDNEYEIYSRKEMGRIQNQNKMQGYHLEVYEKYRKYIEKNRVIVIEDKCEEETPLWTDNEEDDKMMRIDRTSNCKNTESNPEHKRHKNRHKKNGA